MKKSICKSQRQVKALCKQTALSKQALYAALYTRALKFADNHD